MPVLHTEDGKPVSKTNPIPALAPALVAKARTLDATISSATTITFAAGSTFLRVYAIDKDIYLKWGTTNVTAANFDVVIPANQIVDAYIPVDTTTGLLFTACTVLERAATATIIALEY